MTKVLADMVKTSDIKVKTAFGVGTPAANVDQKQVQTASKQIAAAIPKNISGNDASKEMIIKTLTQLDDKGKLLKIRDELGLTKDNCPL